MHNAQCTMHNAQCTMYNVQCTLYTVHCTLYTVHCTIYNVQCTVYNVQCTMYNVQCTMYNVHVKCISLLWWVVVGLTFPKPWTVAATGRGVTPLPVAEQLEDCVHPQPPFILFLRGV